MRYAPLRVIGRRRRRTGAGRRRHARSAPEPQPLRVLHNGRFSLPAGRYRAVVAWAARDPLPAGPGDTREPAGGTHRHARCDVDGHAGAGRHVAGRVLAAGGCRLRRLARRRRSSSARSPSCASRPLDVVDAGRAHGHAAGAGGGGLRSRSIVLFHDESTVSGEPPVSGRPANAPARVTIACAGRLRARRRRCASTAASAANHLRLSTHGWSHEVDLRGRARGASCRCRRRPTGGVIELEARDHTGFVPIEVDPADSRSTLSRRVDRARRCRQRSRADVDCRSSPRLSGARAVGGRRARRSDRAVPPVARRGGARRAARCHGDDPGHGVAPTARRTRASCCSRTWAPTGFTFFTNYDSAKAARAGGESARVRWCSSGPTSSARCASAARCRACDGDASDAYFASRPLDSQIGAWASPQSRVIPDRDVLEARDGARPRRASPAARCRARRTGAATSWRPTSDRVLAGPPEPPARPPALPPRRRRLDDRTPGAVDLSRGLARSHCAGTATSADHGRSRLVTMSAVTVPVTDHHVMAPSPTRTAAPPTCTRVTSAGDVASTRTCTRLGRPIFTPCALTIVAGVRQRHDAVAHQIRRRADRWRRRWPDPRPRRPPARTCGCRRWRRRRPVRR